MNKRRGGMGATRVASEYGHAVPESGISQSVEPNFLATPLRAPLLLCLLALLFVGGCKKSSSLPPLFPVKGKVTVDGQPVTSGFVTLVPFDADKASSAPPSNGPIDSSGNYEIVTGGEKGAPLGKYKVWVSPGMVPAPGAKTTPQVPFNPKFSDPSKTTFVIEVVENPHAEAYHVKLTK
jgi:hypothetical protein